MLTPVLPGPGAHWCDDPGGRPRDGRPYAQADALARIGASSENSRYCSKRRDDLGIFLPNSLVRRRQSAQCWHAVEVCYFGPVGAIAIMPFLVAASSQLGGRPAITLSRLRREPPAGRLTAHRCPRRARGGAGPAPAPGLATRRTPAQGPPPSQ